MEMVDTKRGSSRSDGVAGVKVNRTGRRTYSDAFKGDVVKQCLAPGVSVAAIALSHSINANLVRRWIVREQRRESVALTVSEPVMLPVTIGAATEESRATVTAKATSHERAAIEIEFCGARIYLYEGVDAKMLRRVLDVLAQR
jgi:transposase